MASIKPERAGVHHELRLFFALLNKLAPKHYFFISWDRELQRGKASS